MQSRWKDWLSKRRELLFFIAGIFFVFILNWFLDYTSTNEFCNSCHVHPQATTSWRLGGHNDTPSGVATQCVDCHLPPGGLDYLREKTTIAIRDVYGMIFKDREAFDWEMKSTRDAAIHHVYKSSCVYCHQNLFPRTLSKKGEKAHLYYDQNAGKLRCINCHLEVGHYAKKKTEVTVMDLTETVMKKIYKESAKVDSFKNFTEMIPGTRIDFEMIAIPGGSFMMGSPASEAYRKESEGPQRKVHIDALWMGKWEVTWDEYEAFLKDTGVEGRSEDQYENAVQTSSVDAETGPTPPYGNPDQGWGKGKHPAITMTHYAAQKYCEWLSHKTGKTYRLPTEAEWEYACRGGTQTPYFFKGDPKKLSPYRFWNKIFGVDTSIINDYVFYENNSRGRTHLSDAVKANPFGLVHMLGNVREFCLDWYQPGAYAMPSGGIITNPKGPSDGKEHVIRGGSFKNSPEALRCAARDNTRHDDWLITDPQLPKSLWWYSDCNDVGFRVVYEISQIININEKRN